MQIPYNVERMLWFVTKGDALRVKAWMETFAATNKVELPDDIKAELHSWGLAAHRATMVRLRHVYAAPQWS